MENSEGTGFNVNIVWESKKYCRRCECYFITKKIFCQCCGMQLRTTPAERECKEKMNSKKKREKKRKLGLGVVLKSPRLYY
jgi:hypothetical protein